MDKSSSFKRLAVSRTNKALNDIRLIGNLASANYDSTPEQIEHVFNALRASIAEAEARFAGVTERETFTL